MQVGQSQPLRILTIGNRELQCDRLGRITAGLDAVGIADGIHLGRNTKRIHHLDAHLSTNRQGPGRNVHHKPIGAVHDHASFGDHANADSPRGRSSALGDPATGPIPRTQTSHKHQRQEETPTKTNEHQGPHTPIVPAQPPG